MANQSSNTVSILRNNGDGERWIRATVVGDSLLSDSTRYKGSVIWLTREDLPGVDDTVMFRSSEGWDFKYICWGV